MIQYLDVLLAATFPDFKMPRSERGASAVEYGLLVAGIAAVIVVVVGLLGGQVTSAFKTTCRAIGGASAPAGCNATP